MTAEVGVIQGLGIVFFGLAWVSFKLNEGESELSKYAGILMLALALGTLHIIGWVSIEMATANDLAYVANGVTLGLTWVINIALFLYWFLLLARSIWFMLKFLIEWIGKFVGGQVGKG